MFRSILPFAILILFQTAFAVPVSESKTFVLTDEHIVPKSEVQNLEINSHQNDWIGNIEVGAPLDDLIYFSGVPYTLQNNLNTVITFILKYTLSNDRTIHYVKVVTENNSAVICADSNDLGSSSFSFAVRVAALSSSKVMPLFGARDL